MRHGPRYTVRSLGVPSHKILARDTEHIYGQQLAWDGRAPITYMVAWYPGGPRSSGCRGDWGCPTDPCVKRIWGVDAGVNVDGPGLAKFCV